MNDKRKNSSASSSFPGCLLGFATLVFALACGCSTTKQTEKMLTEAGFTAHPASTEQQQLHLKSLPADQISSVHRNGTAYFVYPDLKHNVLYVGQTEEYQRYLKLKQERELEMEPTPAEQAETQFMVWGGW